MRHAPATAALLLLVAAMAPAAPVPARADDPAYRVTSGRSAATGGNLGPALALARLCTNEAGLRAYVHDDCAAIHAVIAWRRAHVPAYRGDTYVEALHRYSRRAVVDRAGRGRPWIADLWPDAREPAGFCRRCRWQGRGQVWWSRTLAHAAEVMRGGVTAQCTPHHWARSDVRPADPTAHPVDCGDTLNTFWVIPAYARRWPS